MILERREPGDRLPPDLEGGDAVGDPLFGLGEDVEDRLPQPGQRRALGLLQGIEILVDLLSRHDPIVMIDQLHEQGAATPARGCLPAPSSRSPAPDPGEIPAGGLYHGLVHSHFTNPGNWRSDLRRGTMSAATRAAWGG